MDCNVALYCRLSKSRFLEGESISITNQKKMLSSYAEKHGFKYKFFIDDGASGSNMNRDGIKKIIKLIEEKKINILVVSDITRLSREYIDLLPFVDGYLKKHNVRFISLNEGYDSVEYEGDMNLIYSMLISSIQLKQYKKRAKENIENRNSKSMALFGPFGYMKDKGGKIIINAEYVGIIKDIFNDYNSGISSKDIALKLQNDKVITPAFYKRELYNFQFKLDEKSKFSWTRKMVVKILTNLFYTGDSLNRKKISTNNKIIINEKPTLIQNSHDAIISKKLFNEVQQKINDNKKKSVIYTNRLNNFFKCANCKTNHLVLDIRENSQHNTYRCHKCKISFKANILHNKVFKEFNEYLESVKSNTPDDYIKYKLENKTEFKNYFDLKKSLSLILQEQKKLIISHCEEKISDLKFKEKNKELIISRNLIQEQLDKMTQDDFSIKNYKTNFFNSAMKGLQDSSNKYKGIKFFVEEVFVSKIEKCGYIKYQINIKFYDNLHF